MEFKCKMIALPCTKNCETPVFWISETTNAIRKKESVIFNIPYQLYVITKEIKIEFNEWYCEFEENIIKSNDNVTLNEILNTQTGFTKVLASSDKTLDLPKISKKFMDEFIQVNGKIKNLIVECDGIKPLTKRNEIILKQK